MHKIIKVTPRANRGRYLFYPVCDKAKQLAKIANTKTVPLRVIIEHLAMDYTIEECYEPVLPHLLKNCAAT